MEPAIQSIYYGLETYLQNNTSKYVSRTGATISKSEPEHKHNTATQQSTAIIRQVSEGIRHQVMCNTAWYESCAQTDSFRCDNTRNLIER